MRKKRQYDVVIETQFYKVVRITASSMKEARTVIYNGIEDEDIEVLDGSPNVGNERVVACVPAGKPFPGDSEYDTKWRAL